MTREQARRILQIADAGDLPEIKKSYRRLMAKYHPDVLGSDSSEHMRYAQMINEAYQVLKMESSADKKNADKREERKPGQRRTQAKPKPPAWRGETNTQAFCERSIYLHYSMDDAPDDQFYEAALGKYLWNPAAEEFTLFLISLRTASENLLRSVEEKVQVSEMDLPHFKELRFSYQKKIFRELSEQFVRPYQVLRHYLKPDDEDTEEKETYVLQGTLAAGYFSKEYKKLTALKEGQLLYPAGFLENRIITLNESGNRLGYISFDQDPYYFCLIPLLKAKLAQIKIVVKQKNLKKHPSQCHVVLRIFIRLSKEAKDYRETKDQGQIQVLLDEYEMRIRELL